MNIAICGWHFNVYFLEEIYQSRIPAFIVKNREGHIYVRIPDEMNERMSPTGGRGLDLGCYQQYLMKHWDGSSDVLFCQDDGEVTQEALKDVAALAEKKDIDHAWIFRDEYEEHYNEGKSSRAFWMRGSFLAEFKKRGGFYVDWDNCGDIHGRQANRPLGILYSQMAHHPKCNWIAIVPGLHMGRRGYVANTPYQYKRVPGSPGLVTPDANLGVPA